MEISIFLYLSLVLIVGLFSTRLMKILKLPNVTGYLLTGIIMGPFVIGVLFNNFTYEGIKESTIYQFVQQISWISTIALGFIAFSIGTSFKKDMIKTVGKKAIIITIFESLGASILVLIALLIAHFIAPDTIPLPLVLILSAIASATAPAATLMVIKQYKAKGPLVNTLLPVVALDDASALILFAILFQIASTIATGNTFSVYRMIFKPLIEIAISLAIGVVLGFIISYFNHFFKSRNNRIVLCIFSIFAAIGLYFLFKQDYMGGFELSSLLICMMIGAIYVNFAKNNEKTLDFLDRFTSPLFMTFFILSGATLDLTIFFNPSGLLVLLIVSIYLITRVGGKWLGAYFGSSVAKSEQQVKKYLGLTLVPQAGVAIGLASTANTLFSYNPATQEIGALIIAIILSSTLVYELVGPLVSKFALEKAGEISEE